LHDPEDRVIRYNTTVDLADPVSNLQKNLDARKATLDFEPAHGYLISLLSNLNVPVSSQALVFSKTSSQAQWTSPRTPRALYFSDNVYIGWAPGADRIDISDVDPRKGPVFYTLDQHQSSTPRMVRRTECMQCHIGLKTLNVPGYVLRSTFVTPSGYPVAQVSTFGTGQESPLNSRWGGWYVTGAVSESHMGNLLVPDGERQENLARSDRAKLISIHPQFDTSRYLSPKSDVVALLVLTHQVKMHNLLTRAGYETRYALDEEVAAKTVSLSRDVSDATRRRITNAAEPLLEYMLFRNEAPLESAITPNSEFAERFQQGGPRDSKRRSLRELDLRHRLLRYPCSYLIYSEAFDALPSQLKDYLWQRLFEILSGRDHNEPYAAMSQQDREAVFEILRDTKPEFDAWLRINSHGRG
jgi:hypothetical protein